METVIKENKIKITGGIIISVLFVIFGIYSVQKVKNDTIITNNVTTKNILTSAPALQSATPNSVPPKNNFANAVVPVKVVDVSSKVSYGCSLNLSMTSPTNTVPSGENFEYDITVINNGSDICQNASMSVYYADNETFIGSNPKPSASNYYWKFGNMPPGSESKITVNMISKPESNNPNIIAEACATTDTGSDACNSIMQNISGKVDVLNSSPSSASASLPNQNSAIQTAPTNRDFEYGSWVWQSPVQMTPDYENSIVNAASQNGINVLYVTIDDYLNINSLPDGPDKSAKIQVYSDALEKFITLAQNKGIQVDVEAGWRDWAETGQAKANAIVQYAMSYNAQRLHKIRAIQFDIEPYLLPTYQNDVNKTKLLANFVDLIQQTVTQIGTNSIGFNVVIPHFYDDQQKWTPKFSYNGTTDYAYNHLLSILDQHPGSEIIVMAYRNFALGDDSATAIAGVEVTEASTGVHSTKVIVAQETGDVSPSYTTFYSMTKSDYLTQIGLVKNTFAGYTGFGGTAVDYIDPFLQLK